MGKRDDAFRMFFDANLMPLRRLAYRLTGDASEAEELAQDVMVRIYRKWRVLERSPDAVAYARATMLNRHRSLLRRARIEIKYRGQADPPEGVGADDAELWMELIRLPLRQRQALVLHFYEDLPQTKIAELMGCPTGTVNSLVHRGLNTLRARMTEDSPRSEVR